MKKGIIALLLVVIIGVAGVYSYGYVNDKKEEENRIKEEENRKKHKLVIDVDKSIVVNLGDSIYNTDAVKKIKNGKVVSKKEEIDTSKVGEQEIVIEVEDYFKEKSTYKYKVVVEDNEKPVITFNKNISTEEGTKINLLKNVKATDNYDEEVEVSVEGEYDINKPGTYKLNYVAKDSSGNEVKEEFTLTVKKKVVVEEPKKEETKTTEENTTPTEEKKEETVVQPQVTDGSFTTSNGHSGMVKNGITYIDGVLIANKTYSLPSTYNPGLDGTTSSKFNEMAAAAKSEKGFYLYIASGFRSYSTQKNLYNRYVNRDGKKAADTYSARPGHSEHQTGLGIDICDRNVGACINSYFNNTDQALWLKDNAYRWGFILRYPEGKTGETGYKWESWHFRYVGVDLATKLYNGGNWITLENYFGITSEYNY